MKKAVSIIAILMIIAMLGSAFAGSDNQITFRGIEWYTKFPTVNGMFRNNSPYVFENADIDSIEYAEWGGIFTEDRTNEAGVSVYYHDLDVAGYEAEAHAYYMYPIVDGASVRDTDEAEFYLAIYSFMDYEDMDSVYADLKNKLISLYGEGEQKKNGYYKESTYWEDENGNALWIVLDAEDDVIREIRLAYAAGDSKERLAELRKVLLAEKAAAEENERKQNAENTSGL